MLTRKNVANGFNQSGSGYGVVKIDMNKVTSDSYKGYDIYPRVNGVEGLPYHYSVWQQEISVYQMNSAGGRCHDNARCDVGTLQSRITLWALRYLLDDRSTVKNHYLEIFYQLLESSKNLFC